MKGHAAWGKPPQLPSDPVSLPWEPDDQALEPYEPYSL